MRILLALLLSSVVVACGGDGNKTVALETTLDSQPPALTNQAVATFTFHSDPAGDQFICQVDSTDPVQCHNPFTATVADGPHTFSVATLGAHATTDPTPAMATWTVDTTPPTTQFDSTPGALDNSLMPMFAFSGADPTVGALAAGAVTFQCSLDGAAFAACTSPAIITVADGDHTYAVRAVDAATNVDPSPAMFTWHVDSSTPDTTIVSGPADAATSAPSTSFGFTSPLVTATFECSVDGAAFAACTTPATVGPLTDGSHTFAVRAKDAFGVVDPSPATRTWNVDATPPSVTITSTPANPSNDTTPSFGFTSPDATATFECQVDGANTFAACTSAWTAPTLGAGAKTFRVRATDPYGNRGVEATYAWVIDLTKPTVAITGGPQDPTPTKNQTPQFTFTVSDGTVTCQVDATAPVACASPFTTPTLLEGAHTLTVFATDTAGNVGMASRSFTIDLTAPVVAITSGPQDPTPTKLKTPQFTFTVSDGTVTCKVDAGAPGACSSPFTTASLADGAHTLVVSSTDVAGNTGSASRNFTVDTTKPTVTITSGPIDPTPTKSTTPTFTFTVSDGAISCNVDGTVTSPCASPFTTGTLAEGGHSIVVSATDLAGNTGTASRTFTVDTTAPIVTITSGPIDPTPTKNRTPTFAFTVSDGTISCNVDGTVTSPCASPFTTATLADGAHTLVVSATDTAGNVGTASRSFTVDTTPPTVTITTGPIDPTPTNDPTPTFTFIVSDGTVSCKVDATVTSPCTSPFTTSALLGGAHTLTVSATDTAGNVGTATRNFTVDLTAPTVTITSGPQDPTPTKNRAPTFTFTVSDGTVSCNVDGTVTTPCSSPFTTATLAEGAHTLVVSSIDTAGNTGSATRNFTVDVTAPTVTITSGPQDPTPTKSKTPTFTFTVSDGTVSCNVDGTVTTPCTSPFTTASLAEGAHTLVVSSTDLAGNTGSASRSFTVDTVAPTVTITSGPVDPTPTKSTTPAFTFTVSDGTVSCNVDGTVTTPCTSPFTTASLAEGAHTLVVSSIDTAGNTGSATRHFTVDTIAPTVAITGGPQDPTPTKNKTPTFTFTVSDGTVTCTVNGIATTPCTSPFTTSTLADGPYTLVVSSTDLAGNTGTASRSFTIDTIAPTVVFTSGPVDPTPTNDNTPSFGFSVSDGSVTCRVDALAITSPCTSLYTSGALPDGAHTVVVTATDTAGNVGSASRSFTVDTTGPAIVFDDTPPANWPVNYYSIKFHSPEATATFKCSLNGATAQACTSPASITTPYNQVSVFTVTAFDTLGNPASSSVQWTSSDGLVLHYPWEQGKLANTSLLAQRPAYSPDGTGAASAVVGGWAGTAQDVINPETYANTQAALSSSANGAYAASIWIRLPGNANGIVWSTLDPVLGGIELKMSFTSLQVTVSDGTQSLTMNAIRMRTPEWHNLTVRSLGTAKGTDLFLDGKLIGSVNLTSGATGFGANQAKNVTVGPVTGIDLDDLRFYNRALTDVEACTLTARGIYSAAANTCAKGAPVIEFDFEGNVTDTGSWHLTPVDAAKNASFVNVAKLGLGMTTLQTDLFDSSGMSAKVSTVPSHSLTFWYQNSAVTTTIFDDTRQCGVVAAATCGLRVRSVGGKLLLEAYKSSTVPISMSLAPSAGIHGVAITEQKVGANTEQLTVYVDGTLDGTLALGSTFDVFATGNDVVSFATETDSFVDEIELWGFDLSTDKEVLCENGFDGQFDPVTGNCNLTSN